MPWCVLGSMKTGLSLREVAERMGVSFPRISQIEHAAFKKLKGRWSFSRRIGVFIIFPNYLMLIAFSITLKENIIMTKKRLLLNESVIRRWGKLANMALSLKTGWKNRKPIEEEEEEMEG